jgi:hypothetical protein
MFRFVPVALPNSKFEIEASKLEMKFVFIAFAVVVPVRIKLFKVFILVVEIFPFTFD